jgi:hypothetical protein
MLRREIITVCSDIRTKHEKAVCVQNVQGLSAKRGGPYSNQWALTREHAFQPRFVQIVSETKPIFSMPYTDMRHLTPGMRSEKCVFRRIRPCAYVIVCTYTNLGSTL